MGAILPSHVSIGPVSPASIAIVVTWLGGVFTLNSVRKNPRWEVEMPGARPGRPHRRKRHDATVAKPPGSARKAIGVFAAASLITLAAGVVLEEAGNELADRAGINGVIFGATVLAFATALPEISSGLAAVRIGDHALAVADIFGGNAFQVSLFLVADIIAGKPVLPFAGDLNAWLAGLGIVLTTVYAWGVIVRRESCVLRLGRDSIIVVVAFGLGVAGLIAISHG
jgi:cation:H+ antiporter